MAKKKISQTVSKAAAKTVKKPAVAAQKTPVVKKVVKRKAVAAVKGTKPTSSTLKKVPVKEATSDSVKASSKQAAPTKGTASATTDVSLGRPLVTQEEKLYMLFHDDYHSRQVFEFLRVQTVKELEQFSPQQIIHILSKPIRTTVERIRQRLAKFKRSLRDDEQYAVEYGKLMEPV